VRFDAAVGHSEIIYSGVSGTAAASFPGSRWIASAGLTGMYRMPWLEIEPSAKVYAIWERDTSYIDSLGTLQAENTFSTGRASTGMKVAYPIYWGTAAVAPYVGIYADYYFSSENAVLLLPTTFVHGWAARTTAGIGFNVVGGAKVSVGGEVGGLGSQNFTTWSVRGRASLPF
jgi:outer membrane autotransporter protein